MFGTLYARARTWHGPLYPFHIGVNRLDPPAAARFEVLTSAFSDYGYPAPAGEPAFIEAIVEKLQATNGLRVAPENVQITTGGTHALACALNVLLDPGDEVLVLSPHWPNLRGMLIGAAAVGVEVAFSAALADPTADPRALLESRIGPRTAAIYVATPNNPDGKTYGRRELELVLDVARRHELWILSDEVYEDLILDGREHVSIASLEGGAERTLSVFSFSKGYAQAGLRVGYVVGPAAAIGAIRMVTLLTTAGCPQLMQLSALAALRAGADYLPAARREVQAARDLAVAALAPFGAAPPEGGVFLFMDLARWRRPGETPMELLEWLAGNGVLLAPGYAFGEAFASWARICFTAFGRDKLAAGLAHLRELILSRG
jgi:N-succinyldiaminopimelate aminotransferase